MMRTLCAVGIALALVELAPRAAAQEPAADAPPPGPLTLAGALDLARVRNPELLAARYGVEAARAGIVAAGAFPNPEVEVSGEPALGGGEYRFSAGIGQEVPIRGKIGKRRALAESEQARELAGSSDLERRILGAVRRSYRSAQVLAERIQLARSIAELNGRLVDVASSRFAKGEVSELDVHQFEVERALRLQDVTALESARATALIDLCRLLYIPYREDLELADAALAPGDSLPLEPLVRVGLARPSLRALDSAREAAARQVALERAERWADPAVGVFYSQERSVFTEPIRLSDTDRFVGAAVTFPLPLFYGRRGEIEQAVARAAAATQSVAAERAAVERETRDSRQRTLAAYKTFAGYSEGAQIAEEGARLGEDSYSKGLVGAVQLVQVQGQLLGVKGARLDALDAYGQALSDLEEAVGMSILEALREGAAPGEGGRR